MLWRALARFPVPKDIVVYSEAEAAAWKDSPGHLVARALREGRVLYEREGELVRVIPDRGELARRLLGASRKFSPDRDAVSELVADREAEG